MSLWFKGKKITSIVVKDIEDTSGATAKASDILKGKTAYANGELITGTLINEGIEGVSIPEGSNQILINDVDKDITVKWLTGKQVSFTQNNDIEIYINQTNANITANNAIVTAENLAAENIKKDVNILGVEGSYEGIDTTDATATSNDLLLGKTAYVNNVKVEGTIETYSGANENGEVVKSAAKQLIEINKESAYYLFAYFKGDSVDSLIQYNDTENVTEFNYMYYYSNCSSYPLINTSKGKNFLQMHQGNRNTTEFPCYDTRNAESIYEMFSQTNCEVYPKIDVRNVTSSLNAYRQCKNAISILMYGMKISFSVSDCTLLEAEALITILSNCQVVTSTKTLTMGSTLLAKLEGVYVKETGVELYDGITCRPCVICESTDDGAMLATDYFNSKGWSLA